MKKITAILVCLLLVASLAVTAFAADEVKYTLAADKTTVQRGDVVTFTISVNQIDSCKGVGMLVDYDTSVFEYVANSGVATAPTGIMGFVKFSNNNLACSMVSVAAPFALSGEIFTLQLKVLDAAAFGDSNVAIINTSYTDTNNAVVAVSGDSVKMTVECKHSWGDWTTGDATNHERACSVCGEKATEKHAWDAGKVTTEPDCKNDGVKTYTCATCAATKTEAVPSTNEHGYSAWEKVDENSHKRACTGCGKEETAAHAWDDGKVTTEPTCKEDGVKTYTCADCKATKTEAVAKTDVHTWGDWASVDATNHKRVCTVCAKEETAAHAHDEMVAGETTHWSECVCGAKTAEAPHAHDTTKWVADGDNHWHACACGDVIDEAAHTWGEDKKCTVCGAEKPTNPDSGDNAMILAFVALMVLSAAGVAVTVIGKKRMA